jgi:Tol biopolymer transport system component
MRTVGTAMMAAALLFSWQPASPTQLLLEKAQHLEFVDGRIEQAIEIYRKILATHGVPRAISAKALTELGRSLEKLGKPEARQAYQRLVREFADYADLAAFGRARLDEIGTQSSDPATRRLLQAGSLRLLKVSPDGRLAALSGYGGPLLIRNLTSGVTSTIRSPDGLPAGFATSVCFSEDGKYVAWIDRVGIRPYLRIANLEEGQSRLLDGDWAGAVVVSWTPDGRNLVANIWQPDNRTSHLALISLRDGTVKPLSQKGRSAVEGAISQDGRYLLYEEAADSHRPYDIMLMDLASGTVEHVVEHPANDHVLGWTPDDTGVVFVSDRSGTLDIWIQPLQRGSARGSPSMVKRDLGRHRRIGFTRSGSLYQWIQAGGNELYSVEYDPERGVFTGAPAPMKVLFPLNTHAPGDATMVWSPDGRFFAYLAKGDIGHPRSNGLITKSIESGEEVRVATRTGFFFYQPVWSPDQTKFLVSGNDESGLPGIFTIDRRSGEDRRIANTPGENPVTANPHWLPGGKSVLYKVRDPARPETFHILHRNLETGEERRLHSGFHPDSMKLSEDGQKLVFVRWDPAAGEQVLMVRSLEDERARELFRVRRPESVTDVAWMPNGKWLLIVRAKDREDELWRVPLSEGSAQMVGALPWHSMGLSIHPNGRRIGFTCNHRNNELWITEHFVPAVAGR